MEELKPVLTSLSDISRVIKFKEDFRRVSKIAFADFGPMLVSDRCIDSKDLKTHSVSITSTFYDNCIPDSQTSTKTTGITWKKNPVERNFRLCTQFK